MTKNFLSNLGFRSSGLDIVSCPVCGRCEVDLPPIAAEIERRLDNIQEPVTIAVMGCMVNGPGEAKEADIGVACGKGVGVIFKKGVYRIKMSVIDNYNKFKKKEEK